MKNTEANDRIIFDFDGKKSTVVFCNGAIPVMDMVVNDLISDSRVLFVFDKNTYGILGEPYLDSYYGVPSPHGGRDINIKLARVVLDFGEKYKTWESVERILKEAIRSELGRDGIMVGVGGGVVGDLTGFSASVFMRGCPLILVPTTLLSMVDASVGGKTGFDFMGFKNMIGSFYPASLIYIDIDVLGSLPGRELFSGLAEVIKSAMLGDAELFWILEDRCEDIKLLYSEGSEKSDVISENRDLLEEIVKRSVMFKGRLVEEDLQESGKRAWLNLGHTFAHALESVNNFEISHGEAVAWGIGKAMELGVKLGVTDRNYASRVIDLLRGYGYILDYSSEYRGDISPGGINCNPKELVAVMYGDKKVRKGKLRFVLQRDLCDNLIVDDVDSSVLVDILR